MAGVKVKSVLAGKYGAAADKAIKAHAEDDTTYGIIQLPGGIANGIAQLSKCYFKEYGPDTNQKKADGTSAKGEYFFRAEGVVDSPESVATPDGIVPVKGLSTSVMVPFFDTSTGKGKDAQVVPQEEHIKRILNIMRQLGGQEYTKGASVNDLEPLAAGLEEMKPYFRFSTTASKPTPEYPNPRTFENWHGGKGLENYQPEIPQAFNESVSAAVASISKGVQGTNGKVAGTAKKDEEKRQDAIVPLDQWSLDDLVSMAGSEADSAEEARALLVAKGVEAGYSEEELTSEEVSWDDVKNMIENPKQEEEEEQEVEIPVKGNTCKYSPPSKKNIGKFLPERDCQITAVDEKAAEVHLKDLTLKNVEYKGVSFDAIK